MNAPLPGPGGPLPQKSPPGRNASCGKSGKRVRGPNTPVALMPLAARNPRARFPQAPQPCRIVCGKSGRDARPQHTHPMPPSTLSQRACFPRFPQIPLSSPFRSCKKVESPCLRAILPSGVRAENGAIPTGGVWARGPAGRGAGVNTWCEHRRSLAGALPRRSEPRVPTAPRGRGWRRGRGRPPRTWRRCRC